MRTHAPSKARSSAPSGKARGAPRSMWNGSIAFGLVHIPVALYTAEVPGELAFKLLDKRDMTPIRNQRINRDSGKLVPWNDVVRAYERSPGEFVVVTDEDLRRANVEATRTIDILDFVDAGSIEPSYFTKPYYVAPFQPKKRMMSPKAYVLLREALRKTGKIGIAKVVLRTREHLAAVVPDGRALVLNLLRFDHELRRPDDLDLPDEDIAAAKASARELEMAERLVNEMATEWKPERYKDEYRDDVLAMVERKAKAGEALEIPEPGETKEIAAPAGDIVALLRKSLEGGRAPANTGQARAPRATTGGRPGLRLVKGGKTAARGATKKKGGGSRRAA